MKLPIHHPPYHKLLSTNILQVAQGYVMLLIITTLLIELLYVTIPCNLSVKVVSFNYIYGQNRWYPPVKERKKPTMVTKIT